MYDIIAGFVNYALISNCKIKTVPLSFFSFFHYHVEEESASFAKALRFDPNITLAAFYDLLYNEEAKTNALTVLISGAVKLSKFLKQVRNILRRDTCSRVLD